MTLMAGDDLTEGHAAAVLIRVLATLERSGHRDAVLDGMDPTERAAVYVAEERAWAIRNGRSDADR